MATWGLTGNTFRVVSVDSASLVSVVDMAGNEASVELLSLELVTDAMSPLDWAGHEYGLSVRDVTRAAAEQQLLSARSSRGSAELFAGAADVNRKTSDETEQQQQQQQQWSWCDAILRPLDSEELAWVGEISSDEPLMMLTHNAPRQLFSGIAHDVVVVRGDFVALVSDSGCRPSASLRDLISAALPVSDMSAVENADGRELFADLLTALRRSDQAVFGEMLDTLAPYEDVIGKTGDMAVGAKVEIAFCVERLRSFSPRDTLMVLAHLRVVRNIAWTLEAAVDGDSPYESVRMPFRSADLLWSSMAPTRNRVHWSAFLATFRRFVPSLSEPHLRFIFDTDKRGVVTARRFNFLLRTANVEWSCMSPGKLCRGLLSCVESVFFSDSFCSFETSSYAINVPMTLNFPDSRVLSYVRRDPDCDRLVLAAKVGEQVAHRDPDSNELVLAIEYRNQYSHTAVTTLNNPDERFFRLDDLLPAEALSLLGCGAYTVPRREGSLGERRLRMIATLSGFTMPQSVAMRLYDDELAIESDKWPNCHCIRFADCAAFACEVVDDVLIVRADELRLEFSYAANDDWAATISTVASNARALSAPPEAAAAPIRAAAVDPEPPTVDSDTAGADRWSLLLLVTMRGDHAAMRCLLDAGELETCPAATDALQCAFEASDVTAVRLLLRAGVQVATSDCVRFVLEQHSHDEEFCLEVLNAVPTVVCDSLFGLEMCIGCGGLQYPELLDSSRFCPVCRDLFARIGGPPNDLLTVDWEAEISARSLRRTASGQATFMCSSVVDTILPVALERGLRRFVLVAIERGANVTVRDSRHLSLLHVAACKDDVEIIEAVLGASKLGIDDGDISGLTALSRAILRSRGAAVECLLNAGANVNRGGALVAAVNVQSVETIEVLCSLGADLNAQFGGKSPMQAAIELHMSGHERASEIARLLLARGSGVPFHMCAGDRGDAVAQFQASIGIQMHDGVTDALSRLSLAQLRACLAHVNVNAPPPGEMSALRRAISDQVQDAELVRTLVRAGADLSLVEQGQQVPVLFKAASDGNARVAQLLLELGASVRCAPDAEDALEVAIKARAGDCVIELLIGGCDANRVSPLSGRSMLQIAVAERQLVATRVLLVAGAHFRTELVASCLDRSISSTLAVYEGLPVHSEVLDEVSCEIVELEQSLARRGLGLIRAEAFRACIALQDLELPAFVTLQIVDQLCAFARLVTMNAKWRLITAVKHFDRAPKKQFFLARALFDYAAQRDDELDFRQGDVLEVTAKSGDWWKARRFGSETAERLVPSNYVALLDDDDYTAVFQQRADDEN
jgi:ankyrin repeat protein